VAGNVRNTASNDNHIDRAADATEIVRRKGYFKRHFHFANEFGNAMGFQVNGRCWPSSRV
jgi:hypothetical protein